MHKPNVMSRGVGVGHPVIARAILLLRQAAVVSNARSGSGSSVMQDQAVVSVGVAY
jgi:hypothetical protein